MEQKKGTLLIVEDNISVQKSLKLYLKSKFENVITLSNPNQINQILDSANIDVILLDMNFLAGIFTGNEGIFWMRKILKTDPDAVIVLITAYGGVELAVKAIKEGAFDFILKPWDNQKLLSTLQAAYMLRKSKRKIKDLQQKQNILKSDIDKHFDFIIGKSKEMQQVLSTIKKVARTNVNILITGESGTGKELVAREIHRQSKRSDEVMVSIDLSTLNEQLFESELFGHKKGAFTDARENRVGKLETASGGTLFLDEIGNLPVFLQSKLLTVLQSREITPVGSNVPVPIDVHLICATNKNLDYLLRESLFREDLLYRINTIQINIPPLRERGEDILFLAEYFLKILSEKYEKPMLRFNEPALEILKNHHWPGNVRELKHTIEKAVILSEKNAIKPDDLFIKEVDTQPLIFANAKTLEEYEREIIDSTLRKFKGNITYTANELNIGRQTLYRKIRKYGL